MKIEDPQLVKRIFEAALMAAERPLKRKDLTALFDDLERPDDELVDEAIKALEEECELRGYELKRVASGYRYQVKQDLSRWVSKLWQERAPRYSRALLETLSLIAYRQPITRGEIEEIRGVAVSTQIVKTLLEREWIKSVGHRDVPGRPAIYATTKGFLDYFNLKSLDQLPPLAEIRDLDTISRELNIELPTEIIESANDEQMDAGDIEPSDIEAGNIDPGNSDGESTDSEVVAVDEVAADQPAAGESLAEVNSSAEASVEVEEKAEEVAAFEQWIDDELVDEEVQTNTDHSESMDDESISEMQASGRNADDNDLIV